MKSLNDHIRDYHDYHETRLSKITHAFAFPMGILAILILLSWIHIGFSNELNINLSWLATLILILYYINMSPGIGILMAFILSSLCWLANLIAGESPGVLSGSLFMILSIASILLFCQGHLHEKRIAQGPKRFYHISIGLLMLVIDLLNYLGLRNDKEN